MKDREVSSVFESNGTRLFDPAGQRLYLCASEDSRFLDAAGHADTKTRLFCQLLSYTGARISEVLAITPRLLDIEEKQVVFRTLKRRKLAFRAVPVPAWLMRQLQALGHGLGEDDRLFRWSRQTAWRRVKSVLAAGAISGPQATPKGLRHKFGIAGITHGLPETMVQELMGHAKLSSTAIYVRAVGAEKRALVRRMWRR